jgi:hypothetical protein
VWLLLLEGSVADMVLVALSFNEELTKGAPDGESRLFRSQVCVYPFNMYALCCYFWAGGFVTFSVGYRYRTRKVKDGGNLGKSLKVTIGRIDHIWQQKKLFGFDDKSITAGVV